jgi:O-methyltransferase
LRRAQSAAQRRLARGSRASGRDKIEEFAACDHVLLRVPVKIVFPVNTAPDTIALLRLDTDWYESTKAELEALYEKLSPGGVLILDDYGHWEGVRRAVDEFFASRTHKILLDRIE